MQRFYLSTVVPVYKNSLVHIVYTLTCIYETNFNLENKICLKMNYVVLCWRKDWSQLPAEYIFTNYLNR